MIAADGGARHAAPLGRRIDRWVGDGDSIAPADLERLAADGVRIDRAPVDKDESDTELAVLAAVEADPARITILGALGGTRLDHALGNVWLLAHPAPRRRERPPPRRRQPDPPGRARVGRISRVRSATSSRCCRSAATPAGSRPRGLRYPLRDEPLPNGPARGLSNVRDAADARLTAPDRPAARRGDPC